MSGNVADPETYRGEPTIPIRHCLACGNLLGRETHRVDGHGPFCDRREGKGWVAGFRVANATHDAVAARSSPWEKHSAMVREIAAEERAKRRALPWWRRILP